MLVNLPPGHVPPATEIRGVISRPKIFGKPMGFHTRPDLKGLLGFLGGGRYVIGVGGCIFLLAPRSQVIDGTSQVYKEGG